MESTSYSIDCSTQVSYTGEHERHAGSYYLINLRLFQEEDLP